ncbi:isochorismatase family protein [Candidatus Woesearchaeota archaeon]|nr:isochorismatase family protein [Candidatus Woesearchaeota archaeon]
MVMDFISTKLKWARRAISYIMAPTLLVLAAAVCSGEESTPVKAPENTKGYSLIVIDLKAHPKFGGDVANIGYIINKTMEKGMPVVTVETPPGRITLDGWTTNESYRSKLEKYFNNTFMKKEGLNHCAFSSGSLDALLQGFGHKNLVLVGEIGEHCVTEAAKCAIDRGYEVYMSDETCIDSQDKLYFDPPNGKRIMYNIMSTSPLSYAEINVYKDVMLWDRSSSLDFQRLLNLINAN